MEFTHNPAQALDSSAELFRRSDEDYIKHYLGSQFDFRHNIITDRYQYRPYIPIPSESADWKPLTDPAFNSIWSFMRTHPEFKRITKDDLNRIVKSNFTPDYDPIKEYFDNLPVWDGTVDYIKLLASLVTVKSGQEGRWYMYLSCWLVGNVATMLGEGKNHACLILIGGQGRGKSWYLHRLGITEDLTFTGIISPHNKDTLILVAEKTIINLEEMESSTKDDWSYWKYLITVPRITVRRPYHVYNEDLPRRASFCGSTNRPQILGDLTGSRRWWIVDVESVSYLDVNPELMRLVYSQCLAMLRSGFQYWLEPEEVDKIERVNQQYHETCQEQEAVLSMFEPTEVDGDNVEYMTATQIQQELGDQFTAIKFSPKKVGQVLTKAGFQKTIRRGIGDKPIPMYCYAIKRRVKM